MEEKTPETAIDIIYGLPSKIETLLAKVAALEARNAMLEAKINLVLSESAAGKTHPVEAKAENQPVVTAPPAGQPLESPEIMDVVTHAGKKTSDQATAAPPQKPETPQYATIPGKINLPTGDVDPFAVPQATPLRNTATHIKGRLRDRDGSGTAGVDVKIYNDKEVLVKKTKTSQGGVWLAFLNHGSYTVEFSKPGTMKPVFKPITVLEGQRELEVVV